MSINFQMHIFILKFYFTQNYPSLIVTGLEKNDNFLFCTHLHQNTISYTQDESPNHKKIVVAKVRSSYGPFAYFSDIFISGKNVVISAER